VPSEGRCQSGNACDCTQYTSASYDPKISEPFSPMEGEPKRHVVPGKDKFHKKAPVVALRACR
jgi:hypothetical protein